MAEALSQQSPQIKIRVNKSGGTTWGRCDVVAMPGQEVTLESRDVGASKNRLCCNHLATTDTSIGHEFQSLLPGQTGIFRGAHILRIINMSPCSKKVSQPYMTRLRFLRWELSPAIYNYIGLGRSIQDSSNILQYDVIITQLQMSTL